MGWQRVGHDWVNNSFTFLLLETAIWSKDLRDELWFLRFGNVLWRTEFSFFIRLNKKLSRTSSVTHFCLSLDSYRFVFYSWSAWKGLNWEGVACFLGEALLLRICCQKLTVKFFWNTRWVSSCWWCSNSASLVKGYHLTSELLLIPLASIFSPWFKA